MYNEIKDWTHKGVSITDIRKLHEFYIFTISFDEENSFEDENYRKAEKIDTPLTVKHNIFEDRLKPYFFKDGYRVTRSEIMGVKWNMYVTKGYYIKISRGEIRKYQQDPDKYYVSFLEIDGPLGTFQSIICKDKENIN